MVMNRYLLANNLTLKFDMMHFTKFVASNKTLIDMANFLLVDCVREELKTCLN
jgi:hypothetical protein